MLERPPTVVPTNVVPVGTIDCPRNCRPGGFEPSLALAPGPTPAANAGAAALATIHRATPSMTPSISRSAATGEDATPYRAAYADLSGAVACRPGYRQTRARVARCHRAVDLRKESRA